MQLSMKKAFNSPFGEEKWYIKLAFPFIMAILGLIASAFYKDDNVSLAIINILTFIPGIILGGFYAQFAHNEIHDISPLLPDLDSNIGDYLKYGFKLLGIVCIYFSIAIAGILLGMVALKLQNFLALIALILIMLGMPLGFIFAIPAEGIFFDNFCFKDALDYKKVLALLSKVKMEIAVYFLICFCFMMLMTICNSIVEIFNLSLVFVAAFVAAAQLVIVNLSAQIYKIAKARLE